MTSKKLTFAAMVAAGLGMAASANANLIVTGAYDGGLSGGLPKGIELFVTADIADLSIYGVSSANNGGGPTGAPEFTLFGSAVAGQFIYIATDETNFNTWFGFNPDFTSTAMSINGDDAIEVFESGVVIDVFGDVNVDGTGEAWDHLDGWAYRNNGVGANGGVWSDSDFFYSGINVWDGATDNATSGSPMPIGTYQIPAPGAFALLGIAGLVTGRRRR